MFPPSNVWAYRQKLQGFSLAWRRPARPSMLRLLPTDPSFTARLSASPPRAKAASSHRRQNHRPQSNVPDQDEIYYVLTLQTDPSHHRTMCSLRERYFPPALLRVGAHISLFRALPDSGLPSLREDIAAAADHITPFQIHAVGPPIRMGRRGVGVPVLGLEPVVELVRGFQEKWGDVLSRQDRGTFRGHYTLMNKVDDSETVARCIHELRQDFGPNGCPGMVLGLSLWRYDDGWWRHEKDFAFSGAEKGGGV
ncbi:hypothetical protein GGS26DRAFT_602901 [Hypomontagnella submonticulosa]|nr:hypothetical protein GGS26DRAFT_602901 [Hypomontagnella submonticulosa]